MNMKYAKLTSPPTCSDLPSQSSNIMHIWAGPKIWVIDIHFSVTTSTTHKGYNGVSKRKVTLFMLQAKTVRYTPGHSDQECRG